MTKKVTHIVSLKENATKDQKAAVEKHIEESGGEIIDRFDYGGFGVVFPQDKVNTLESHPDIDTVENNGPVKIQ